MGAGRHEASTFEGWPGLDGKGIYGSSVPMCDICGDCYRFTDWTQLALDECHEVWFLGRECMCGYTIVRAMTIDTAMVLRG